MDVRLTTIPEAISHLLRALTALNAAAVRERAQALAGLTA